MTSFYLNTLKNHSGFVFELYEANKKHFKPEYSIFISPKKENNGMILKMTNPDEMLYMGRVDDSIFTSDVINLSNSMVYLEKGQTPINFLQNYFAYLKNAAQLTEYRIKQYYQFQKDSQPETDDVDKDPTYIPFIYTSSSLKNVVRKLNFDNISINESDTEADDVTKDPDYIPSESEYDSDEYSSEEEEEEEDYDSSSDYEPSESGEESEEEHLEPTTINEEETEYDDSDDSDYVPSESEYDSDEYSTDEE